MIPFLALVSRRDDRIIFLLVHTFAQYPFLMPFILIRPFISSIDTGYYFTLLGLATCTMKLRAAYLCVIVFTHLLFPSDRMVNDRPLYLIISSILNAFSWLF